VRVEERGYAEIVDELEDGLAAVSVPIMLDGELVASINASGPTVRFDDAARGRALPSLRRAAASVERRLVSVIE
jgi:DNA-binding IclR family transcriptional regulator